MTLTEFLLARIDEDEAWHRKGPALAGRVGSPTGTTRVLAECEAKRRIVSNHTVPDDEITYEDDNVYSSDCPDCWQSWPCETLRLLALPYADHGDYDQSWRPNPPR